MVPLISMMAVAPQVSWHGEIDNPHTTDNIKAMKDALIDGQTVNFKEGEVVVKVKQGPEAHKRTAPFGVLLSVITAEGPKSALEKKINKEKWIYLMKSGETHVMYPSFRQYKIDEKEEISHVVNAVTPSSPGRLATWSFKITSFGLQTLSYGGGVLALRSVWWASQRFPWLRHPAFLPMVVVAVTITALTPSMIAEFALTMIATVGGYIMSLVAKISTTWLGDPWFWFLPGILVVGFIISSWCSGHGNVDKQPLVWDHQALPPKEQIQVGREPQKRESSMEQKKDISIPVSPRLHQKSLQGAEKKEDPTPTDQHKQCHAGSLLKMGNPDQPLSLNMCTKAAVFVLPLVDGDVVSGIISSTKPPSVALCEEHWADYNQYRNEVKCHIPNCTNVGIPFTSNEGTIYECKTHTQRRVIEGGSLKEKEHPRGWKKLKEEPVSPPMPPLEPPPISGPPEDRTRKLSYTTVSTASNQDELVERLKGLGGRNSGTSKQRNPSTSDKRNHSQEKNKKDYEGVITPREGEERETKNDPTPSTQGGDSHSADSSESGTEQESSGSSRRRKKKPVRAVKHGGPNTEVVLTPP